MAAPAAQNAVNPAPTPFEHKLAKFDLEGHFHYTFTLDLELDLSDPKLDKKFALDGVPLAGKWQCRCWRKGDDMFILVRHGDLPIGIFGAHVRCKVSLFRRHDNTYRLLESSRWWSDLHPEPEENPEGSGEAYTGYQVKISRSALDTAAENSNGEYCVERHRSYRVILEIESLGTRPTSEAEVLIRRMPALDLSATPQNVRLFFPHHEADLWADSSFLSRSSPYLKTLLSSNFAESVTVPSKRPRTRRSSTAAATPADADAKDFVDSDDETDELYLKADPPLQHERDDLQHPYKEIKVTQTAFTTYRAVLAYLRTGFIAFAPLSSTFSSADVDAPTRASRIEAVVSADPSLPYPVSPKSTFRLAHLFELDELQHLCLANLSKQLTVDCAPYELFSDTSVCYDVWREVVLDFVVSRWAAVTETAEWKETMAKLKRDEVPGAMPIMVDLLELKAAKAA